jgi:hypothetical protein
LIEEIAQNLPANILHRRLSRSTGAEAYAQTMPGAASTGCVRIVSHTRQGLDSRVRIEPDDIVMWRSVIATA